MRPIALVGVAAVAVGLVAAVDRGIAAALDPSAAVVTLIGVLGAAQGVRYAGGRRGRDRRAADPGDPERRVPATVPGTALDDRIARAVTSSRRGHSSRRELRDRVRSVVVAAVERDRNCAAAAAATAVDAGSWTDGPTAAAFLASGEPYPLRVRLRAAVRGRPRYVYGLRAALDAIERLEANGSADAEAGDAPAEGRR
ncbi:DUF7269 family protein [Halorubrum amylolyticum]|uniref:DUF7269 family protein n=1 Tax=Halorubrum amylolyticum TaxID=2508724 RepID=UPI0010088597|nr:hypothetical protein [Halorubrum amylolyticum]